MIRGRGYALPRDHNTAELEDSNPGFLFSKWCVCVCIRGNKMAAQGFSGALKLTDLDDFIAPSQVATACSPTSWPYAQTL